MSDGSILSSICPAVPIILASGSQSRKTMLADAGIDFKTITSEVDEDALKIKITSLPFDKQVIELAKAKAQVVSANNHDHIVIDSNDPDAEIQLPDISAEYIYEIRVSDNVFTVYTGNDQVTRDITNSSLISYEQPYLELNANYGETIAFNQSHISNSGNLLMLSTSMDGIHAGGTDYTQNVTIVGTPGNSGAFTELVIGSSLELGETSIIPLHYYSTSQAGMGNIFNIIIPGSGISTDNYRSINNNRSIASPQRQPRRTVPIVERTIALEPTLSATAPDPSDLGLFYKNTYARNVYQNTTTGYWNRTVPLNISTVTENNGRIFKLIQPINVTGTWKYFFEGIAYYILVIWTTNLGDTLLNHPSLVNSGKDAYIALTINSQGSIVSNFPNNTVFNGWTRLYFFHVNNN